jgi:hypothetical protein
MENLTYEKVVAAIESLNAAGDKPTTRNIRLSVGSGSATTIIKFLKQWKEGQVSPAQSPAMTLDQSIVFAINNQFLIKLAEATNEANAKTAEQEVQIYDLIQENDEKAALLESQAIELSKLNGDHFSLLGRFFELETASKIAKTELNSERQAHEVARLELAIAQQRLEVVPRLKAEVEKLNAELLETRTHAVSNHEAAAIATAKFEAELSHRQLTAEQSARELRTAQEFANNASMETRKVREEIDQLRRLLAAASKSKNAYAPKKPSKKGGVNLS